MTGFKVYDMSGITAAVMKFELIYTEVFSLLLRLYELLTIIGCIDALEAFFINLLNGVFAKAGDLCHLLVCISSSGKQITGILMKGIRNEMSISLKGDKLALCSSTPGTTELVVREQQSAQVSANAEMTDVDVRMRVDMHPMSTSAEPFFLRNVEDSAMTIDSSS